MEGLNACLLFLFLLGLACNGDRFFNSDKNTIQPQYHSGGLLLTDFSSLEDLKQVIDIKYEKSKVTLTHQAGGHTVTSILKTGIAEGDFTKARDGSLWDRVWLGLRTPYAVINRSDLICVEILGRRRHMMFGEGDVAFYDLAEKTVEHIREDDRKSLTEKELSEKGYLNTFNHITAQALMTTIFSETLADYISDVHERQTMPELITGEFTQEELVDTEHGPVDNYLDMINNEWGQDVGKALKRKFFIHDNTVWTPRLLTDYLNELQYYYAILFDISFQPFKASDNLVIRFADKINVVREDVHALVNTYY